MSTECGVDQELSAHFGVLGTLHVGSSSCKGMGKEREATAVPTDSHLSMPEKVSKRAISTDTHTQKKEKLFYISSAGVSHSGPSYALNQEETGIHSLIIFRLTCMSPGGLTGLLILGRGGGWGGVRKEGRREGKGDVGKVCKRLFEWFRAKG